MPVSLVLIVVLLVLGTAFIVISLSESLLTERQRRATQALGVAEAGAERALYDLRQDFVLDATSPSWTDGDINGMVIGPDTVNFYVIPYTSASLNSGSYSVWLKNIAGTNNEIWIKSTGTVGNVSQTISVYAKMTNTSPWANAIFAGAGASGAMVNGNVNISGSVHILGTGLDSTDYAIDMGGTAELVRNNYTGLAAALKAKVPALPTTIFNGETVSTLNSKLRVKRGIVGISGSSSVGEPNVAGNTTKETVDGAYVTDGYGGNQAEDHVYSDNGWSNGYDLGDTVTFPSLSDPYPGYATYQQYLRAHALVINDATQLAKLAAITPSSNFDYSDAKGRIKMDGSGNMVISGIVYVEGGNLNMNSGTINYTGTGSILVTGNVNINTNLLTPGNNSFPTNIMGVMTPGNITFDAAQIDVMGLFYAETTIKCEKQTDVLGTFVSNYFDMGTNVPAIYQVPDAANHLPPGLIGQSASWALKIVSWQKI